MSCIAIKLTKAELWYLINAIPQAGIDDDDAGEKALEKIWAAYNKLESQR